MSHPVVWLLLLRDYFPADYWKQFESERKGNYCSFLLEQQKELSRNFCSFVSYFSWKTKTVENQVKFESQLTDHNPGFLESNSYLEYQGL